jgi:hypothetical protein
MKRFVVVMSLLIGTGTATAQEAKTPARPVIYQKTDCAQVTQRMIEQYYSIEKQSQIQDSPEELGCIDYICARSYEFVAGQAVLRSQRAVFNIQNYQHLRHPTLRITVYDEISGLNVMLYSWNEVETALSGIRQSYRLASSPVKPAEKKEIKEPQEEKVPSTVTQ